MTKLVAFLMTACVVTTVSCAGINPRQPLSTVTSVDLTRYAGKWHEIARLPMWFQRHCRDSHATYTIRRDGKISVHNECITDGGTVEEADGIATIVDPGSNAKLMVTFDNFFARLVGPSREGNYWIIHLDPEYQVAMVGTPDRRYLWILSRTPHLDEPTYEGLVAKAQHLGFPISHLLRAQRLRP